MRAWWRTAGRQGRSESGTPVGGCDRHRNVVMTGRCSTTDWCTRVRETDPLPNAQVKAGGLLVLAGAFEDARSRANRALELDPSSVDALILLANAKAGLKDLDGALSEYREAATLYPNDRIFAGM